MQLDLLPLRRQAHGIAHLRLEVPGHIDLPDFLSHTLVASLRVPLDRPVLVGGMTNATSDGRPPSGDKARTLYLVISLHADRPAAAAGAKR